MRPGKKRDKRKRPEKKGIDLTPERESEIIALVYDLAGSLCEAEGLELVLVQFRREPGGRILRLFIDGPNGVAMNDCVIISRQLSDILDVNIEEELAYNLEVSSPGLDRPLVKEADYERFKGKTARIYAKESIKGQKKFTGNIKGIFNKIVVLVKEDKEIEIPFGNIKKARLVTN